MRLDWISRWAKWRKPIVPQSIAKSSSDSRIEHAEAAMLKHDQVECPLKHSFAPGVYLREVFMPAGTIVIGHRHKTEHFNIVLQGKASVMIDGVVQMIESPCTFVSGSGVRKVLYIHEDMRWATVHPTTETNLMNLEERLIIKSDTFLEHEANRLEIQKMRSHIGGGK